MNFEENSTFTFTTRNGYGITIGATPVQGGDNTTFTNNVSGGGTLTFTGAFWSNANNAANRTMTIGGNGNTTITGNIIAAAAATEFNHNITKAGSGTLQITSTASTLDGNLAVQNGIVQITDFRSVNMHSGGTNTGILNIGSTTITGVLNIGTATAATAAGLTMSPTVSLQLPGTTGGGTVNANQTQAFPVLISANVERIWCWRENTDFWRHEHAIEYNERDRSRQQRREYIVGDQGRCGHLGAFRCEYLHWEYHCHRRSPPTCGDCPGASDIIQSGPVVFN